MGWEKNKIKKIEGIQLRAGWPRITNRRAFTRTQKKKIDAPLVVFVASDRQGGSRGECLPLAWTTSTAAAALRLALPDAKPKHSHSNDKHTPGLTYSSSICRRVERTVDVKNKHTHKNNDKSISDPMYQVWWQAQRQNSYAVYWYVLICNRLKGMYGTP